MPQFVFNKAFDDQRHTDRVTSGAKHPRIPRGRVSLQHAMQSAVDAEADLVYVDARSKLGPLSLQYHLTRETI